MTEEQRPTNEVVEATPAAELAEPKRARPRVWTVFVALLAALVGSVGIQIVIVAPLVAWRVAAGMDVEKLLQTLPAELLAPAASRKTHANDRRDD